MEGIELTLKKQSIRFKDNSFGIGFLIFNEDEKILAFQDAQQKIHDITRVYFLNEEWNLANGNKNLPKPYVTNNTGSITDYGANLLYAPMNSPDGDIIVFGCVHNLKFDSPDEKLDFDLSDIVQLNQKHLVRNNDQRYYSVTDDGQGNLFIILKGKQDNGNFALKIAGDSNQENGNVKIEMNGKFLLNQVDDNGSVYSQLYFDNTSGNERIKVIDKHKNKIELNKTGTIIETQTIRIGKSETVAKLLLDLIQAIRAMTQGTASGGPTIAPPFNDTQFQAIVDRINNFMDKQ